MQKLKTYLPPIMKTPFYTGLMDEVEGILDNFQATHTENIKNIYSLSDSSKEVLFEIASSIYLLDKFTLQQILDFLVDIQNHTRQTLSQEDREQLALEILRAELMKIPYSMADRGTLKFYRSIFSFLSFRYNGYISLMRTRTDSRMGALETNFRLELPSEQTGFSTQFTAPRIDEDFTGLVSVANTLDEEGDFTLDTDKSTDVLDQITVSQNTLYKKNLFIGLLIDERTVNMYGINNYTFPEKLGRFYNMFLDLNKRATDSLVFGPILSLDIQTKPQTPPVLSHRLTVDFPEPLNIEDSDTFLVNYYSKSTMTGGFEDSLFYQSLVSASRHTPDELTLRDFCQGEQRRIYNQPTSSTTTSVTFKWDDYRDGTIFKLCYANDAIENYSLYGVKFGQVYLKNKYEDSVVDWEITQTETELTFSTTEAVTGGMPDTLLVLEPQTLTIVHTIEVVQLKDSWKGVKKTIGTLSFNPDRGIGLSRNTTLMTHLRIK